MSGPYFLTAWEREDYERQQRGEKPLGPFGASARCPICGEIHPQFQDLGNGNVVDHPCDSYQGSKMKQVLGFYVVQDGAQIAWFRTPSDAATYARNNGGFVQEERNEVNDCVAMGVAPPGVDTDR
jgi:hypothetical protein